MRRPSGDHDEAKSSAGPVVSGRKPAPSAFITTMANRPSIFASKVMRVPSGDHAGA